MVTADGFGFLGDSLFSDAECRFRQEFSAWLDDHPIPFATGDEDVDVAAQLDWQGVLAGAGYAALHWPREHGGGRQLGEQIVALEELARRRYDPKLLVTALYMVGPLLFAHGSPEQIEAHAEPMRTGRELWCQLFSEPDAGSDLANVRTLALRDGDHLVINGQKVWTSYAQHAAWGLLICRTDPESDRHRGISVVMVDMTLPGITIRPLRQMDGSQHFSEVFFDDVVVPIGEVVGPVHDGWSVVRSVLGSERSAITFTSYAEAVAMLLAFTEGDVKHWSRDAMLDAWSAIALQRLTSLRAGSNAESDPETLSLASVGKLQMTTNRKLLAVAGLSSLRSDALAWSPGDVAALEIVREFLASPSQSIGGGTSEVQRNAVGELVLGLPR